MSNCMKPENLIGKVIETQDGQKWFCIKLEDEIVAFNRSGYFKVEALYNEQKIYKVYEVKDSYIVANLKDILGLVWEK